MLDNDIHTMSSIPIKQVEKEERKGKQIQVQIETKKAVFCGS